MPIVVHQSRTKEGAGDIQLGVEVSGMVITTKAGAFKWGKVDYAFSEDVVFTAAAHPTYTTTIFGYLVIDDNGDPQVFVVEQLWDSESEVFEFNGSDYSPIILLFRVIMPVETTTLEDLITVVGRLVPHSLAGAGE